MLLLGSSHPSRATAGVSVRLEWGEACQLTLFKNASRLLRRAFVRFCHCAGKGQILPIIARRRRKWEVIDMGGERSDRRRVRIDERRGALEIAVDSLG